MDSDNGENCEEADLLVLDSIEEAEEQEQVNDGGVSSLAPDHTAVSKLKKEVHTLRKENARLREHIRHLRKRQHKQSPVQVIFHDKGLAKHCKAEVEEFIHKLIKEHEKEMTKTSDDLDDKSHGSIQLEIFQSFCVDSTTVAHHHEPKKWKAPLYDQEYNEALDKKNSDEGSELKEAEIPPKKIGGTCFNCLGSHVVNECPQELDGLRIRKNRSKFSKPFVKSNRYHVEERLSNIFQPGTISENLRQALDLQPNQLPPYIYRMRILGYPPGWMKEAEIESSGLTMYDSEGKAITDLEDTEDGEVDTRAIRVQHDPKKLVDFPGFNIYPAVGTIDEAEKYGAPPLQQHHLRTYVERTMKPPDPQPYRKKKLPSVFEEKAKKAKIKQTEEDMEVEDISDSTIIDGPDDDDGSCKFIPPLPPDSPVPPPPPSDAPSTPNNVSTASSRSSSPSLTDLEEVKMKLMKELEQVGDSSNVEDLSQQSVSQTETTLRSDSAGGISDTDSTSSNNRSNASRLRHHDSPSLMVAPGTPVGHNYSGFSKLPGPEKFSKDITDHLPFENLPNSTGKYDKMRDVLKRVRQKMHET